MRGGGVRGKIVGFTPASRKRMLEWFARVRNFRKPLFVTLTYPAVWSNNPKRWKRDLDTFLKRLVYIAPRCFGVWRIEPQERGAPHFHLLLTNHPSTVSRFIRWVKLSWYKVVGSGDEKHLKAGTRVEKLFNRQHAMFYCSKYAGKVEREEYQFRTTDGEVIELVGKHWGVFNREAADTEQSAEYTLTPQEQVELRRTMARWLKSKGSHYGKMLSKMHPKVGFSIFGLGDAEVDVHRLTIYRMLLAAFDEEFTWNT